MALENQRESYSSILAATEERVMQANLAITKGNFSEDAQGKQQAAQFLSQQIYALYEERRHILAERDHLKVQNTDLQRLNVALKIDLEKYTVWAKENGVQELIERLE